MKKQPENLKKGLYPDANKIETWRGKSNKNVYQFRIYMKDNPIPFTYTVSNSIANTDSSFDKVETLDFE